MKRWLFVLTVLYCLPAAAQVDPNLVGMWQLQWIGPDIFWQVRADGIYRLVGVGARPGEHWGRMQASSNKWSSEWERGADSGGYELRGNTWVVTGALGPGTWMRVWPGQAASSATCPHIDVAAVERHFASAVRGRMVGNTCDLNATKVGIADGLSISTEVINPSMDTLRLKRADCGNGTNRDPAVRCIPGLGDVAFFDNGKLYIYRQSSKITIGLGTYPQNAAVNDADSIALGRVALSRL